MGEPHRVVVVGGGFGGLTATRALRRAAVQVTLIDRANHHLFQPLLYQVAMAGLAPADIASPIRSILRRQRNAIVLLGEVRGIDLAARTVRLDGTEVRYDSLIVASGARTSYFGNDAWEGRAPGLKDLRDAIEIRERVLTAFERAERETDPAARTRLLTFVVIGGGPTGVELAGALRELARYALARDFRAIDPGAARVVLVEAGPRILTTFPEPLSARAVGHLQTLGVEVRTGKKVTALDEAGVHLGDEMLPAATVLWAAGVRTTPLTGTLGVPLDRAGRVLVERDLSVPGHPEAFVIGDAAAFLHQGGSPLPGVAPVAMQQGRFVARNVLRGLRGLPRETFHYADKGNLATIGRSRAVADFGRIKVSGLLAWIGWLTIHIFFLIGFRNRLLVLFEWMWSYVTYQRGDRLIVGRWPTGTAGGPMENTLDRAG
jgi:NADH:quinone reductase (non-electrogenic)